MRVLHVLAETGWSGGEVQLDFLVRHLVARGHANRLVLAPDAKFAATASAVGVPVDVVDLRRPLRVRVRRAFRAAVTAFAPDVLHFGCGRSLLWGGIHARGIRVPVRVTTRRIDYPIGRFWRGWRYRSLVDHVVANSIGVQREVLAAGVAPDRVSLVHEGIDLAPWQGIRADRAAARQRLGIAPDALLLACAAALRPRKGQRDLLHAFALLRPRFPQARLFLAGDGTDLALLRRRAVALGIDAAVHIPGAVRPIRDLYAAADVFCMPSFHEGLSNACLEAGAAGLPQVVSPAGGLPEIVADGETGLVVRAGDPNAWSEALSALLADPARRERMGTAAAARVAALFPAQRMVENMERLFERLLRDADG